MPPEHNGTIYIQCYDLNASAREPYDRLNVHGVRQILNSGEPELLHDTARAWGDLADRMEDVAGLLKSQAGIAAEAWQGGTASADFQNRVGELRGQATTLAAVASSMRRMVQASADTLHHVRTHFVDSDEHAYNPSTMHNNDHAKDSLRQLGEGYEQAIRANLISEVPAPSASLLGSNARISTSELGDGPGGVPPFGGDSPPAGSALAGGRGTDDVRRVPARRGAPIGPVDGSAAGSPGSPALGSGGLTGAGSGATSLAGYQPPNTGAGFGDGAGVGGLGGGVSGGPVGSGFGGSGSGAGPGVPAGGQGSAPPEGLIGSGPGARSGLGPGAARGSGGILPPAGGAGRDEEQSRTSWLTEDRDVWGVGDLEVCPPVLGGDAPDGPSSRATKRG